MQTVAHVLQNKISQDIYTISPDATVLEAISLMADKGIGALVVTQAEKVTGIISERDYARKVALMERSSYSTVVSDIMTHAVVTVTPGHSIKHCMQLMTDKHLRHLPVVENGQLTGLVSIGDLVKSVMEQQQALIEQLQQYISG
ncbi:CBS domain-containing protein [Alkanindiges sp. WGS2144]|uniref:CBS domain-containing protein n=1 Tax=Alkanindiges sp. WGS2144 TaxID=3366808 RepID=UPI003753CEFC